MYSISYRYNMLMTLEQHQDPCVKEHRCQLLCVLPVHKKSPPQQERRVYDRVCIGVAMPFKNMQKGHSGVDLVQAYLSPSLSAMRSMSSSARRAAPPRESLAPSLLA